MSEKTRYVTAYVSTINNWDEDVVLSLVGPKGGTRALEAMTAEQAADLRDKLTEALETLKAFAA